MITYYILKKLEKFDPAFAAELRINGVDPDKPIFVEAYRCIGDAMEMKMFYTDTHEEVCEQFGKKPTTTYSVETIEVDPDTTLADVRYFESAA